MTTPTVEVPIRVLNETIGAFMLSAIIGAVLQGVNIGQAIFYFRHQKTDPLIMKCLILFVLAVNVFHFFLVIDALYLYTVDGRSNPSNLNTLTWSVIAILLVSVVGDLGVKGIFSYRVWKLSRQWMLSALVMVCAFITFGLTTFTMVKMIMAPTAPTNPLGTYGSLITLALSDIMLSIVLAFVFWRRRSVFPIVNRLLRFVVLYSMETSLITSIGAIAGVVTYAVLPNTPVFMAILWVLPKLILSSLFVALNARQKLRLTSVIGTGPVHGASHRSFDVRSSGVSDF